jgi:hypothetical protein
MNGRALILGAALAAFSLTAMGGVDVGKYKSMSHEDQGLRLYISGISTGFLWANAALMSDHQPALFCQPASLMMNVENDIAMLDAQIANGKEQSDSPIGMVLLIAYKATFPCR